MPTTPHDLSRAVLHQETGEQDRTHQDDAAPDAHAVSPSAELVAAGPSQEG